jgi:hypothetical protein
MMSRKKIQFDTCAYKTHGMSEGYAFQHRVAKWNSIAAGKHRRSTNTWAEKLSKAEITSGEVMLEETLLQGGLIRRTYTHVTPIVEVEAEAEVQVVATVKRQVKRRRKQKDSNASKWRRLTAMRSEMDRLAMEWSGP